MSTRFKAVDRETPYLLPPSVQDWLPEEHLARFVVDVTGKLDLHKLKMPSCQETFSAQFTGNVEKAPR